MFNPTPVATPTLQLFSSPPRGSVLATESATLSATVPPDLPVTGAAETTLIILTASVVLFFFAYKMFTSQA